MGYPSGEIKFPPAIKRDFPVYWRLLIHHVIHCITGKKSGFDEISQQYAGVIDALVNDLDFNYSKFILDEMKYNKGSSKRKPFLMYPRFIQMIINSKYQEIESSTTNSFDLHPLGLTTAKGIKGKSVIQVPHRNIFGRFGGWEPFVPLEGEEVEPAGGAAQEDVEEEGEEE